LDITAGHSRFADRVLLMLERVEYRRAETPAEKAASFRLRHQAYTRAGTVAPRPSGLFEDSFDAAPNVWLIGVYIDGDLAGSLRLHVSASLNAPLPALVTYRDILEAHLRAGRMIIDGTRFVVSVDYSRLYSEMPYITIRPTFLAEEFFGADFLTAACLVEHQAFYKRVFGGAPWAAPREYPNFNRPMAFLGSDCRARRAEVHARYPFFRSTDSERSRLFGRSSNLGSGVLEAIRGVAASELARA
jgi:hypothetical protein